MAKHHVFAWVSLAALPLLGACTSQSCTLVDPVPGVLVDTADFPIDRPEEVEVCVDDRCVPLYELEVTSLGGGASATVIFVEGDDRERTIVIRSHSGQILAGPAVVDLTLHQPNGEDCPGAALQGRFGVNADGIFLPEPPSNRLGPDVTDG